MNKIFKQWAAVMLVCLLAGTPCLAATEGSFIYKFYNEKTGDITRKSYITVKELPDAQKEFTRQTEGADYTIVDTFVVDQDFITSRWRRTRDDEDTEYTGEKKGKTLFIKGVFKGKPIDKKIALDDKPFYDIPKFNLSRFALSDAKNVQFWMLRKDRLSKILMQAKKRGEATILVNGKEMDVIKVYFSATGVREKYYNQIYYYRKSDGVFVKKTTSRGEITDLVSEKKLARIPVRAQRRHY